MTWRIWSPVGSTSCSNASFETNFSSDAASALRAKGSDGSEITRRQQRPQLALRTADRGDDLNVGDNVFHLNHNIAPSGR